MNKFKSFILATSIGFLSFFFSSCKKDNSTLLQPYLIFKFKFDSTQIRLNNLGQPATVPSGNAAQSGKMNLMSAHYIELTPDAFTQLGKGAILYHALETSNGGATAIDFEKAAKAGDGEIFYKIPLKDVPKGNYEWLRISLAYQNGDVKIRVDTTIERTPNNIEIHEDLTATMASFIGYNNYIKSFNIKNQSVIVNGNRKQGYWGFETNFNYNGMNIPVKDTGQAPPGTTTVVNPLFNSSPIPQGSCVVTAAFANGEKLNITGSETKDIVVECSFSTNKSIEWTDLIPNGKWEPLKGEKIVDMGVRGLIPRIY
ncbi:MAG: hypothetical protein FGM46_07405 [Ferruginibacter sp.]|nr:hypothetical protein [Ferruginibacter sp.]